MKLLNLNLWNRKEHFHFFKNLDNPFFTITVDVDFTSVYLISKKYNSSFFLSALHAIMFAANQIENFRYRLDIDNVVCYDIIHASSTVGRDDGTFGFSFFEYDDDIRTFIEKAKVEIERVKNQTGLAMTSDTARQDVIHYSSLPWVHFTSLTNEGGTKGDSIPKITTGKCMQSGKYFIMPVSIAVNHALVDGLHIGQYFEKLQEYINNGYMALDNG